ncbi:MAG: hypothetical protein ABEJ31_10645 [Haloarculaceae archaeon]
MELLWFVDRATALVAYPALYVAVLTGIFYNSPSFGVLHELSREVHVELAAFATIVTLGHGVVGVADSAAVLTGAVPAPAIPLSYFVAGALVGAGALLLVIVAVLGFLDARRFERPWGPRVVHAFAYGGFAFATVHAAAVGTDVGAGGSVGLVAGLAVLAFVLVVRLLVETGIIVGPEDRDQSDARTP